MSLADDLELAWETLEVARTGEVLVRTLDDLGFASGARVGVDDGGARELLFAIPPDAVVAPSPSVRGVRVLVRTLRTPPRVERFLVVRCDIVTAHRVFARFAADVLEQSARALDVPRTVVEVLGAWRELFRRESVDPETVARGLYGELDELRRLVAIDKTAVASWRGPAGEPQDFVRGRFALEVKSTRSRARAVEVHGLEQLWSAPFDALMLAVKHVATDAGGESVEEVVRALLSVGVDPEALEGLLEPFGGLTIPETSRGPHRFRVREVRYFTINEQSPVLTPASLSIPSIPSAVSEISYMLSLDSDELDLAAADVVERISMGLARG